jgi:predicted transcriptional regulator
MTRIQLLEKVKARRKSVDITIENLAKLSNIGTKTLMRFFAGDDVKLSTVEKVTNVLGLDFAGNEIVDIKTLKEIRAKQKALYIVSLVQDTSSLEMQGLENDTINEMIEETKLELLYGEYKNKLWAS